MKGAFPPDGGRCERCAEPGAQVEPGRKVDAGQLDRGRPASARPRARRGRRLEVKVPSVEPFTRPVLRDLAQHVMDAHLARMSLDEMA